MESVRVREEGVGAGFCGSKVGRMFHKPSRLWGSAGSGILEMLRWEGECLEEEVFAGARF